MDNKVFIEVDQDDTVVRFHTDPDSLSESDKANGIVIQATIPNEPALVKGKSIRLKYCDNSLFWEYFDRPLTQDEIIDQIRQENIILKQQISDLNLAMAAMIGGAL